MEDFAYFQISKSPRAVFPNLFDLAIPFENVTQEVGPSHYLQL